MAHAGPCISTAHWDAFVKYLTATLDEFKVPAAAKDEFLALAASLNSQIAEKPQLRISADVARASCPPTVGRCCNRRQAGSQCYISAPYNPAVSFHIMMNMEKSLQETYAPQNSCFGCGPANPKGLRIRSFVHGDEVVAEWTPEAHHEAFPEVLNGGIIGALLDCHSNWAAAWHLMRKMGVEHPPCTVTSEYSIKLLRPTPMNATLRLVAVATEVLEDRALIDAKLIAGERICATCKGTFVAVKPGHPAYHRW